MWIGIGTGVITVLIGVAAVLYFMNRNSEKEYDYSDGKNPEVEVMDNESYEEEEVTVNPDSYRASLPHGAAYLDGTLADFPFTMDLYIDNDGTVKGQYWNVLYDISLPVSGHMDSAGNLSASLGTGSEQSHLELKAEGSGRYGGTWGKNNKIIEARLTEGKRSSAPRTQGGSRIRIKGNGINKLARLSDDYFYYEDQGSATGHWLRAYETDYGVWEITNQSGERLATIDMSYVDVAGSGTMTDISGKTFTVTFE